MAVDLASYAVPADASARKYPEPGHPYRSCFQRDRDRIIHCSAFRRLDFKTQVFVPHQYDHFRTRLTHSLEVAQIGRDLARALGLNEDLVEAVALAHDLGHPPFGHAGETVLNERMTAHGHFEHNRQSLRIVDYLEHPYPQFRGLNLTNAVRHCLAKHETRYDTPASREFDDGLLPPLEGQLVDLADEIAYTSADLEDALAANWIDTADLAGLEIWDNAWRQVAANFPDARPIHKRIRATKQILAIMADNLLAATRTAIAESGVDSSESACRLDARCVRFDEDIRRQFSALQDMLFERVYRHDINQRQNRQAGEILGGLFDAFVDNPDLLPPRYRKRIDAPGAEDKPEGLHRIACDYLAGMTDQFCRKEFTRIQER